MLNGKELLNKIDENKLAGLYLFTGEESYLANQVEKKIIKTLIPQGLETLNLSIYEDKKLDASEMIANFKTLPLMSPRRIIIIRETADLMKLKNKKDEEAIIDYLLNPNQTTLLLIYWEKPDKRRKLYKTIEKQGIILDFKKLNGLDLAKWIRKRFEESGKIISKAVIDLLIERSMYLVNEDKSLAEIDNYLDQLIDYAGPRGEILEEDILSVLAQPIEDGVFNLIDYAMKGQKDEAISMLGEFYLRGESPFGLFSLLIRQIRQLILVKSYQGKNTPAMIAKEMKLTTYIVNRILKNARLYSLEKLWDLLVLGADLDYQMKSGEINQELALELFVLKIGH